MSLSAKEQCLAQEMIDLKKDLPNKSWKKYYELAKILQK